MVKYKVKYLIILFIFLLIPLAFAETTFFDNPDDTFIMGSSTTEGVIITEEQAGGGGCLTNWSCSPWSSCINGKQTRNCTKEKPYCYADLKIKPIENQNCFVKTKNNTEFKNNGNLTSRTPQANFRNIVPIFIALIIIIGIIVFSGHKKHGKKRYYSFGY